MRALPRDGSPMPRPRRFFPPEYNAEVVELIRATAKTVGQIARGLDLAVILDALELAISRRRPPPGLVCHCDHGCPGSTPHSATAAAWPPPTSSPRWGPWGMRSTTRRRELFATLE